MVNVDTVGFGGDHGLLEAQVNTEVFRAIRAPATFGYSLQTSSFSKGTVRV